MMNGPGNRTLPVSEACERNKEPIGAVLREWLPADAEVLEIGSGTGQHVVHFATEFPRACWQPTDTGEYLAVLRARVAAEGGANIAPVIELDVCRPPQLVRTFGAVFTANTVHFMSEAAGAALLALTGRVLRPDGVLVLYGPFNYEGEFTALSNERFDAWLKSTDPVRGIRDIAWVTAHANAAGLELRDDVAMPANNRCLIWQKTTVD